MGIRQLCRWPGHELEIRPCAGRKKAQEFLPRADVDFNQVRHYGPPRRRAGTLDKAPEQTLSADPL